MPKIKFDVSGTKYGESSRDFVQAPPGVYQAKVASCKPHKKKGESKVGSLEVKYSIVKTRDGKKIKENYSNVFDYVGLGEASEWKYASFLEALGLATASKRKGTFDTDDAVGKMVLIRVKVDDTDPERRKVGGIFPIPDEDDVDDDEEDDDDVDDEEGDEEEEDEAEEEDEESEEDEDESEEDDSDEDEEDEDEELEDEEEDDYSEWELADLRAEAVSRKLLKKKDAATKKKAGLIKLLEADDLENDEDEEDEDEPPF